MTTKPAALKIVARGVPDGDKAKLDTLLKALNYTGVPTVDANPRTFGEAPVFAAATTSTKAMLLYAQDVLKQHRADALRTAKGRREARKASAMGNLPVADAELEPAFVATLPAPMYGFVLDRFQAVTTTFKQIAARTLPDPARVVGGQFQTQAHALKVSTPHK